MEDPRGIADPPPLPLHRATLLVLVAVLISALSSTAHADLVISSEGWSDFASFASSLPSRFAARLCLSRALFLWIVPARWTLHLLVWSMKLAVYRVNHVLSHGYNSIRVCLNCLRQNLDIPNYLFHEIWPACVHSISIGWFMLNKGFIYWLQSYIFEAGRPISLYTKQLFCLNTCINLIIGRQ